MRALDKRMFNIGRRFRGNGARMYGSKEDRPIYWGKRGREREDMVRNYVHTSEFLLNYRLGDIEISSKGGNYEIFRIPRTSACYILSHETADRRRGVQSVEER